MKRIFIWLFWIPIGFPMYILGALTAYGIDAFNEGNRYYDDAINYEIIKRRMKDETRNQKQMDWRRSSFS